MSLLTLPEAKAQLNITSTDTDQDAELQAYIDAIGPVIESYIGPVESRDVTQTLSGHGALCLGTTPVLTITSVTSIRGVSVDPAALYVDAEAGLLRHLDGTSFRGGPWVVVYTAGRAEEPLTVNLAARMLLQHMWQTQNRTTPTVIGGGDDYSVGSPVPGFGYAVPNRVLELLAPYRLAPAVA